MQGLKSDAPIAVFDSGLGGISVLREMLSVMPEEQYLYFGDSKHAPYGVRTEEELCLLCEKNLKMLMELGCKCLVIACNTATSAAADYLRARYPDFPIIGIEPAVKPAAESGAHPRVIVLATPFTIRGERLLHLLALYREKAEFILIEAPEIVSYVEAGFGDNNPSGPLKDYIDSLLLPYRKEHIDAIVLGCTHFPFVKELIAESLGYEVKLFDGAHGTAVQTKHRLSELGLLRKTLPAKLPSVRMLNSAEEKIPASWRMLSASFPDAARDAEQLKG